MCENSMELYSLSISRYTKFSLYQMASNVYVPNCHLRPDSSPAAYQNQHSTYMGNYHRYDMGQMYNSGSLNSYMNAAAAAGYGMCWTVSGGQISPYVRLQQPGSPYSSLQQQPGLTYGLTQPGSPLSCQSHRANDSSSKSEPESTGSMHSSLGSAFNNHLLMKREHGSTQQSTTSDLNHLIIMFHILEGMQTTAAQQLP